jgi:hypothetical protein
LDSQPQKHYSSGAYRPSAAEKLCVPGSSLNCNCFGSVLGSAGSAKIWPAEDFVPYTQIVVLTWQTAWRLLVRKRGGAEYVRATYPRWFVDGLAAGSEPNLSGSLKEIGQDPARVIAFANSGEVAIAYDGATFFGAPTFVTGGEVLWG